MRVAVRVRPMKPREVELNSTNIISMRDGTVTTIVNPLDGKARDFTFDYSFDSDATQQKVWDDIGAGLLADAFKGFNVSLFAYGQTGSGKS